MQQSRRGRGLWGETQACAFLERQGFRVIDRNFYTTVGEIDIVAIKNSDYYFVEVKTREAGSMANNLAVTYEKQRKCAKLRACIVRVNQLAMLELLWQVLWLWCVG